MDSKPITSEKQFLGDVKINNLNVEKINGINFEDVAKVSNDGDIRLYGDLSFENSVVIGDDLILESGLVNDVEINKEFIIASETKIGKFLIK